MHFLQGIRQSALGRKTSFRSNLFQRHDFSPFATRETSRRIDVFNANFAKPPGIQRKFIDATTPADFAPFGIVALNSQVYVTYGA
jgi:hypothetical protein